jgi:hypothetical protein
MSVLDDSPGAAPAFTRLTDPSENVAIHSGHNAHSTRLLLVSEHQSNIDRDTQSPTLYPDMEHTLPVRNGHVEAENAHLPALQSYDNLEAMSKLDPVVEDDPASYDLVAPAEPHTESDDYSLEKRSQLLFSREHLQVIFADPGFLFHFTSFLGQHRPQSVPILIHYLDSLKAIRAIHYANAICEGLDPVEGLDFTRDPMKPTVNAVLEARASSAFDVLVKEELPAFITHQYISVVSLTVTARITGSLAPHLRDASEGLAEVFCLTDPARQDNPIVFASEGETIPHNANLSI